jgi:lysophospholipase L1-like esterase
MEASLNVSRRIFQFCQGAPPVLITRAPRFAFISALMAFTLMTSASSPAQKTTGDHWVGTWATSPMAAKNASGSLGATTGTTLREIAHVSIGGSQVRVVLSNEFGLESLTVDAAGIALRTSDSTVETSHAVPLMFGGRSSVVIPAGALVVSDAAILSVKPLSDVAVSLFLPAQPMAQMTRHGFADQTNYMVDGNMFTSATLIDPKKFYSWDFLKGIDVKANAGAASAVMFGDSITDGALSTRDKNARWPDVLAARLAGNSRTAKVGVLNEGIGGNRVLHDNTGPSALARFDRDVLSQAGVKYLVIMESINDIGHSADPDATKRYDIISAEDLIVGFQQMATRAHLHGIKVYGATLTPYVGAKYQSPEGETIRRIINQWIRTTKDLDGFIDFDKVTADPANPGVFMPAYDSGDHLHPKDAGYKAMGESVDLKLFTK